MTAQSIPYARGRSAGRSVAAPRRGPRILPLAFFTLLVMAVFFSMIFLRIALDRSAFELESFERQIATQESRQLDLRLELAQLQDPLRIATEATRMGLTYPEDRVAIIVEGLGQVPITGFGTEPLQALTKSLP
jgi:cell division protein FtsL